MSLTLVRILFVIAGAYDFLIGLAFLFFGAQIFDAAGIPHPNHWAYIQFAALLVAIFGALLLEVARDPRANRILIPYGLLLKLSYVGLVLYYWVDSDVPFLFKPFVFIDAVMFGLFALVYYRMPEPGQPRP